MKDREAMKDKKICGAKTRADQPCRKPPMANGRCKLHGGNARRGPAHPRWKDGRRSRYAVPARLQEQFRRSINDPELTSLRSELVLMDSMVNEVLVRFDAFEPAEWKTLEIAADALQASLNTGNDENALAEAAALVRLIKTSARQAAAVHEVANLLEKRSRIAAREHRRMVNLDVMVRFDEFLARVVLMMGSVKEHVSDPATVARIATAWESWLGPIPGTIEVTSVAASSEERVSRVDSQATDDASEDAELDAEIREAFETAIRRVSDTTADSSVSL